MPSARARLRTASAIALLAAAGCGGDALTPPADGPLVFEVVPSARTVPVGGTLSVRFTVTNTDLAPLEVYGGGCRVRVELRTADGDPVDGDGDLVCTQECAVERFVPGRPRTFTSTLRTRPFSNRLQREVELAPGTYQVVGVIEGERDDCGSRRAVRLVSPPETITITR